MSAVVPGSRSRSSLWARTAGWVVSAVVLGALAAISAEGLDAEGRARLVRYVGILASIVMAVGALHVLYPVAAAQRLQLSNPSPRRLLRHQLSRWLPVPMLLAVPAVFVAMWRAEPLPVLAVEGAVSVLALGLYAFARVSPLGLAARAWERGERGRWYRAIYTRAPSLRYSVPDAMVPGLNRTAEVFVVGSVLSIAGQAVGNGIGTLVPPVALALVAGVLVARQRGAFDRAFWTSHGVWADAFRQVERHEGREPVRYGAIYWAPRAVRPAVWAGLVSLDRRLPLGRVAAVGLALVAAVHFADVGDGVEATSLALYVLGINGAMALASHESIVPGNLARRVGGVARWSAARFLMNVRWVPPLVATLGLLVWLVEDVGWSDLAVWTLVDLGVAALSAFASTLAAHLRSRRVFA